MPGHADGDVWMDVCCHGIHRPQKVAVLEDGWLESFYLDLSGTEKLTEISFYRADGQASDALDAHASKTNEDRKFHGMAAKSWPKTGLDELFTMQVDRI